MVFCFILVVRPPTSLSMPAQLVRVEQDGGSWILRHLAYKLDPAISTSGNACSRQRQVCLVILFNSLFKVALSFEAQPFSRARNLAFASSVSGSGVGAGGRVWTMLRMLRSPSNTARSPRNVVAFLKMSRKRYENKTPCHLHTAPWQCRCFLDLVVQCY